MRVSASRNSIPVVADADMISAMGVLRLALGYDAVTLSDEIDDVARFTATVAHTLDEAALSRDWAALEAHGVSSVFQSHSWQHGLATHLLGRLAAAPVIVTLTDLQTGEPAAIFPLQIRTHRGLEVIEYLGHAFCDTCQPLLSVSLDRSASTLRSLIAALIASLPSADIISLTKMQRDLFGVANPFNGLKGCRSSADETFPVELTADAPGFVAETSAYKAYQKQWRKLTRREGISVHTFESPDDIGRAFDAMIALRQSRFTDLNRDDLLNEPEVAAFYRAMALLPEPERAARIVGLKVGDTFTAYIYMMDRGGKFSTVISAIDNSVGNAYAPGLILFTKIFERAIEQGYSHGDIGVGWMHYKTRFAARKNPLFAWERGLSIKGKAVVAASHAAWTLKQWAKENPATRAIAERVLSRKIGNPAPAMAETRDEP